MTVGVTVTVLVIPMEAELPEPNTAPPFPPSRAVVVPTAMFVSVTVSVLVEVLGGPKTVTT